MVLDGVNGVDGNQSSISKVENFETFVENAYAGIPEKTTTLKEKEATIKAKKAIMQHPKCPAGTKTELQREIQIIQGEIDAIKNGPSIFM